MPYRYLGEIATADAAFEAWGANIEELFREAADATLNVMVEDLSTVRPDDEVTLDLENADLDLLLFAFLNDLIYYKDARQLLLRAEQVRIRSEDSLHTLHAVLHGEKIDYGRHHLSADVKAVTLHRFKVEQTAGGWQAMVVLDI